MSDPLKSLHRNDPPQLREAFALEGLKEIVGSEHERLSAVPSQRF